MSVDDTVPGLCGHAQRAHVMIAGFQRAHVWREGPVFRTATDISDHFVTNGALLTQIVKRNVHGAAGAALVGFVESPIDMGDRLAKDGIPLVAI